MGCEREKERERGGASAIYLLAAIGNGSFVGRKGGRIRREPPLAGLPRPSLSNRCSADLLASEASVKHQKSRSTMGRKFTRAEWHASACACGAGVKVNAASFFRSYIIVLYAVVLISAAPLVHLQAKKMAPLSSFPSSPP